MKYDYQYQYIMSKYLLVFHLMFIKILIVIYNIMIFQYIMSKYLLVFHLRFIKFLVVIYKIIEYESEFMFLEYIKHKTRIENIN